MNMDGTTRRGPVPRGAGAASLGDLAKRRSFFAFRPLQLRQQSAKVSPSKVALVHVPAATLEAEEVFDPDMMPDSPTRYEDRSPLSMASSVYYSSLDSSAWMEE
eukprot:c26052_g1_i1.p2 GENE.c26052_g1_i1~~c26052_g1_i1.p2  ORF type:complete len:104 (-),score=6.55 c26052_g1_i1:265-576(-)